MVKRVKDMSVSVKEDGKIADTKKVLSDVQGIDTITSIETDSSEERRSGSIAIVPDSCPICDMGIGKHDIKYYDVALLKKFMSVRGKIIPRIKSGVCARHQKALKEAVQRARYLALLPFVDVGQE